MENNTDEPIQLADQNGAKVDSSNVAPLGSQGRRVFQPSEQFVREMEEQRQIEASQQKDVAEKLVIEPASNEPTPTTTLADNSSFASDSQAQSSSTADKSVPQFPTKVNANSIYPQVNERTQSPTSTIPDDHPLNANVGQLVSKKSKMIIPIVMVIGSFIVVVSSLSLISWIKSGLAGSSATSIFSIFLSVADLLLGIGILLRSELARSIYVILAVIGLIFSAFGMYNTLRYSNSLSSIYKQQAVGISQQISEVKNNSTMPASEKALAIQRLQAEEKQASALSGNHILISVIEDFVIAVLVLVFFTRSSVKEVFR